jgi:hypothetical protein
MAKVIAEGPFLAPRDLMTPPYRTISSERSPLGSQT